MSKIENQTVSQPYPFEGIIQEPVMKLISNAYTLRSKDELNILIQRDRLGWFNVIALASVGLIIEQLCKLVAFVYRLLIGSAEDVVELKRVQGQEMRDIGLITIISMVVFFILILINKYWPTPKRKLLKKILKELDGPITVFASEREEKVNG